MVDEDGEGATLYVEFQVTSPHRRPASDYITDHVTLKYRFGCQRKRAAETGCQIDQENRSVSFRAPPGPVPGPARHRFEGRLG